MFNYITLNIRNDGPRQIKKRCVNKIKSSMIKEYNINYKQILIKNINNFGDMDHKQNYHFKYYVKQYNPVSNS